MIIGIVGAAGYLTWQGFSKTSNEPQVPVKIQVEKGMTAAQIADVLEQNKVIKSAFIFRYEVKKKGVGANFQPGTYNMKTGMDYNAAIKALTAGPPIKYIDLTIPEGWTSKQITERVSSQTKIDAASYLSLVTDGRVAVEYPFLQNNGAPTKNLEGYLYPQTYKVPDDITAEKFLNMQLAQFQKETESLDWEQTQSLGRTPYEILVIASLIERETRVNDEKPLVASVIYNRLAKNMLLQIDATVQYALPEWKDKLTYDDLKVESPYNTYLHQGLPPGPICNPSASSIEAALTPGQTQYLYYVLAPDNSGRHTFAATYDEFLHAKAQYQASQNGR